MALEEEQMSPDAWQRFQCLHRPKYGEFLDTDIVDTSDLSFTQDDSFTTGTMDTSCFSSDNAPFEPPYLHSRLIPGETLPSIVSQSLNESRSTTPTFEELDTLEDLWDIDQPTFT